MDILELIDDLDDAIDNASTVPLTGKSIIDKEAILDIIQEIRLQLPEDLKQAKWVKEERQRILFEAQKEADAIIKGAEERIVTMVNEHEITKQAKLNAQNIIDAANDTSDEIKTGTRKYVDGILEDIQKLVSSIKNELYKSLNEVAKQSESLEKLDKILQDNRDSLK